MNSRILEVAFDHSLVGIMVFNETGNSCLKINKAAKQLLEIDEEMFHTTDLNLMSLCITQGSVKEKAGLTLSQLKQGCRFYEAMILKPNNRRLYAEFLCHYDQSEKESIFVLMFRDIFPQLKLQREIRNSQEQIQAAYDQVLDQYTKLVELEGMKNKFMALTSHELKTPLSALVATTEILFKNMYDNKEQHDDFVKILYEQSRHLWEIVKDILDLSKIQSGKFDIYIESKNIVPVVQSLLQEFEEMAKTKNLTFKWQPPEKLSHCYFDEVRMRQIIGNVLSNAIKFTHESTQIEINSWEDDIFVFLSVLDHGPGIKLEDFQRIFNEFETINQINHHHHGTGLGLPISRRLIEMQGGQINVRSEVNSFAEFRISIPKNKILENELYRSRNDSGGDWLEE